MLDETYVKVVAAGRICTGPSTARAALSIFISSSRRNSKKAQNCRFLGKILNNVKKWQIRDSSPGRKRPPMVARLLCSNAKAGARLTLNTDRLKYRNNVIECDHGKLKRIINATLAGFKSMKTAYATIKGIEVMRALRKTQASAFYYGDPLGEMRLVSRVFEM